MTSDYDHVSDYQKSEGDHYRGRGEWKSHKKLRTGRLTVEECEVHILHLEDEIDRQEKQALRLQKQMDAMQQKLEEQTTARHNLELTVKLLEKDTETQRKLIAHYKDSNRLIEVLLGLGCAGLGALPSLHPIIEKGATKNGVVWLIDLVIVAICLALIFVPNFILRGKRDGN